ncbi:MAG: TIR domain-containing protein [Luteolibacter sp.]|uniref:TIR domain-containing protein n=1 Tax=Luteolibacter sp. TaxID=1962973 RepID=UPI003267338E
MPDKPANLSPIRIYILWHPGLDIPEELKGRDSSTFSALEKAQMNRGIKLARRIYHWFRMENMDGIPVYFRSTPLLEAGELPQPIEPETDVRNYVIPLVDANMVASTEWRQYVSSLAKRDDDVSKNPQANRSEEDCRLFPIAMESVAYNMPEALRQLNFIRHVPSGDSLPDDAELLAKLTEILCRDLRYWLLRESKAKLGDEVPAIPGKIRIFLSHAKADDTDEALVIKEYIQRNTQCEAFFDETDIASGYDYAEILKNAVTSESAGLIVIQGDNYADRPWCRKEIRDFLKPVPDPLASKSPHSQYFIPPVVVVQTMKGKQLARTIPELGYSPCLRWDEKQKPAGFVVTTLLREILFGLFYRVLADRTASFGSEPSEVFINRAPDPVMVSRILKDLFKPGPCQVDTFVHPGYGLSKLEMDGLLSAVIGIQFKSFLDRTNAVGATDNPPPLQQLPPENSSAPLAGKIIALSAGTPGDILATGQSDEHVVELLTRLLRPIISSGASVLYGGKLPENFRPETPWNESLNFTALLLSLLLSERETSGANGSKVFPRLILPVAWHARKSITKRDIAQWMDICSILFLNEQDLGFDPRELPSKPAETTADQLEDLNEAEKRRLRDEYRRQLEEFLNTQAAVTAVSLSAMRKKISDDSLDFRLPDAAEPSTAKVQISAYILIGGAMSNFDGIMPGIFEEALYALQARKPLYIIGACGGAAAVLARHLLKLAERGGSIPPPKAPPEFTAKYYSEQDSYGRMLAGIRHRAITCNPNDTFKDHWSALCEVRDPASLAKLLNNGLTGEENLQLLSATSFGEICDLVLGGMKTGIHDSSSVGKQQM